MENTWRKGKPGTILLDKQEGDKGGGGQDANDIRKRKADDRYRKGAKKGAARRRHN